MRSLASLFVYVAGGLVSALILAAVLADIAALVDETGAWALLVLSPGAALAVWAFGFAERPD